MCRRRRRRRDRVIVAMVSVCESCSARFSIQLVAGSFRVGLDDDAQMRVVHTGVCCIISARALERIQIDFWWRLECVCCAYTMCT